MFKPPWRKVEQYSNPPNAKKSPGLLKDAWMMEFASNIGARVEVAECKGHADEEAITISTFRSMALHRKKQPHQLADQDYEVVQPLLARGQRGPKLAKARLQKSQK